MADNIFENLTDEEQNNLWMYMIFNRDKIIAKTEQWTKEAEEGGMTLTEYLESISPLNNKEKLSWLGKSCKDCGNEKCKKLGTLPKGCDCALWQEKECGDRRNEQKTEESLLREEPDSVSNEDVIYRQDAIDALKRLQKDISGYYTDLDPMVMAGCGHIDDCIGEIQDLPSAQPEHEERTVESAQNVPKEDLISRKAAIDALNGYFARIGKLKRRGLTKGEKAISLDTVGTIETLQSAQPERQKGEWIDYTEDGYVECSFCHSATNCDGNKDELHFCFSCGADMRGEQDDS